MPQPGDDKVIERKKLAGSDAPGGKRLAVTLSPCHLVTLSTLLLLALLAGRAAAQAPSAVPPIRTVLVPPERVPALLEKSSRGVLVQLPQAEFDKRLKQAEAAAAKPDDSPCLVRANYRAELNDLAPDKGSRRVGVIPALVGRGDWTILNPGPAAGVLPLPKLRLPLQNVKLDDADVVLGELLSKGPALWVEKKGQQTVTFDWSLRGSTGAGEIHFDFQAPPCAASLLELTLPADYRVSVSPPSVLLQGPDFGGSPKWRVWRLNFAGRSKVSLVLRRTSGRDSMPTLLLAGTQARQQLFPDRQLAEYKVTVEALHQPLQELTFDLDRELRPTEVTCTGLPLRDWEVRQPEKGKAGSPVLIVRLREPLRGQPVFRIVAEAPLSAGRWVSPTLRLRGAVTRLETLELRVHPDTELADWTSGGFRLLKTTSDEEGFLVLYLTAAGTLPAARPAARVGAAAPLAAVRQTTWWHIGPGDETLTADFTFDVLRGRVFQLALRLPVGNKNAWPVEKVELAEPPGLLRGWATTTEGGRPTLLVDLQHSLAARQRARLTVRLRTSRSRQPAVGRKAIVLTFPQIGPLGPGPYSGALAVSMDSLYHLAATQASVQATQPIPGGPWGKRPMQLYYEYRDTPLIGQIRLVPHRPILHARCLNEVLLAAGRASLKVRLTLDPVIGTPETVIVYLSAPGELRAAEGEARIRLVERLPIQEVLPSLLALGGPAAPGANAIRFALLARAARPAGSYWRLVLTRPLTRTETVDLQVSWASPPAAGVEQKWLVPILTVPGADRLDGEVVVQLVGAELLGVQADGVREGGGTRETDIRNPKSEKQKQPVGGAGQDVWRVFRYGTPFPDQLPALGLRTRPLPAATSAQEICEDSRLTTRVEPDGRLVHHFAFRMRGWRARTLPLRLPPGTELLGAQIQGRWVERIPQRPTKDGLEIALPMAAGASLQDFEVLYSSVGGASRWLPWARLKAAVPKLPVRPLAFRRTWQLPPGLVPLGSQMQQLPDPAAPVGQGVWVEALRQGWQTGRGLLTAAGPPFAPEDWATAQHHRLEDAEAALHRKGRPTSDERLGLFLERLVQEQLRDGPRLVIDAAALRKAGIGPDTPCAPGSPKGSTRFLLERLGLADIPCRSGVLLTTRSEWQRLQDTTGQTQLDEGAVAEAVAQAVRHGQDASGRFLDVAAWLSARRGVLAPIQTSGWTEWEPLAGASAPEELLVVRRPSLYAFGLALAGLLCLAAWHVRSALAGRWRVRLLLVWLAVAGLLALWLPRPLRPAAAWPALAGLVVACVWYLRWPGNTATRGGASSKPQLVGSKVALLLVFCFLLPAASVLQAGGTGPDTIYVLPGPAASPGRQSVLVPPELLRKLDALGRHGATAPTGAILIRARYQEGVVHDAVADFKADFLLYCADDRAVAKIPLGGVELKEGALLEGAPIYPVSLPAPERGYAVTITGRKGKLVRLVLPFSVRLSVAGDGRDLSFSIPRLVQGQLDLALPAGAQRPQALTALGDQAVTADGHLRVNLGLANLGQPAGESVVRLHWTQAGRPRPAPAVRVREFYLWDLRTPAPGPAGSLPDTPALTAVLQYTVTKGAVSHLEIDLAEGTEVRSIEAGPQQQPAGAFPLRLKSWRIASRKGKRRLTLELSAPATDKFQVMLSLLPRLPLGPGTFSLILPAPVSPPLAEGKSLPGLLAYRVDGLEAADQRHNLKAINIPFVQFVQQWEALGLRNFTATDVERASGRAYSFNRDGPAAALELMLASAQTKAIATAAWTVAADHADLQASARLTPGSGPTGATLTLLEWEVPSSITLADVSGPDVQRWFRSGVRLQVWLRQPKEETVVQLTGWVHLVKPSTGKGRPKKGTSGAGQLILPCVRLLSPRPSQTEVSLTASGGVVPTPAGLANLRPSAEAGPLTFQVSDPSRPYRAVFSLRPAAVSAKVGLLTTVEERDGWASFTTQLQVERPPGKLRPLIVSLHRWPGTDVRLEAPGVPRKGRRGAEGLSWTLRLPASGPTRFSLKLVGKMPLPAGLALPVPEVRLAGAVSEERWLAVLGGDLHVGKVHGLAPVRDPAGELSRWPAEAKVVGREGSAWKVLADDWRLELTSRRAAASSAVTVLLAEQSAAVADGQHWLYESVWTLAAEAGADLHIRLPAKGQFLAAAVDGRAVQLRQTGPQALWLPLPGIPGAHQLRVRWLFEPGTEALDRPRLLAPVLQEGNDYPVLWTVWVPPGYHQARPGPAKMLAPLSRARLDLERAAAQLRLAQFLTANGNGRAGSSASELPAILQDFAWYARQAEMEMLSDPPASAERGPSGQKLEDWLHTLRRQAEALTHKHGLGSPRPGTDNPIRTSSLLGKQGLPISWHSAAGAPSPSIRLEQTAARQAQQDVLATELLLGLLLAVWILSHLTRFAGWLRRLWPEQLLILAFLGWQVFGPSLIGVVLIGVALVGRLLLLARHLPGLLRRQSPAAVPSGGPAGT
jgi:hypothetical protein